MIVVLGIWLVVGVVTAARVIWLTVQIRKIERELKTMRDG